MMMYGSSCQLRLILPVLAAVPSLLADKCLMRFWARTSHNVDRIIYLYQP